ncbi:metalloregulator ArsR/SmtB family transcription factor [Acidiferrobacter sp.]|jgi:ArsR family transcriptional regulator|uniref:ArsR/SmtB family transcription factor n=1 Tax=Acidiferrobacter sp. TaxID=1872107 RepID=UPI0026287135|nr:metalloregulator ArsR/SmtB family transcription factor [Acidiferrobacter sp.]
MTEDDLFSVLSHAIRRRLLMLLEVCGELCVCDLTAALDLPQTVVSRQLAVLRARELVATRKRGTWVYYRRHPDLAPWVAAVIAALGKAPGGAVCADDARRLQALRQVGPARCDARYPQ